MAFFPKIMQVTLAVMLSFVGCGGCTNHTIEPNIREMPGAEFCDEFCAHMAQMGPSDPLCQEYADPSQVAADDGGTITMSCTEWCVFEQKNSIQLNPECMSKVSKCSQVDCASRLNPGQCPTTAEIDKLCPTQQ